jgi:hypothetical protein
VPNRVPSPFSLETDAASREGSLPAAPGRGRPLHPLEGGAWIAGSPRPGPSPACPERVGENGPCASRRQRPARMRARSRRRKEQRRRYRLGAYFLACVAGVLRLV